MMTRPLELPFPPGHPDHADDLNFRFGDERPAFYVRSIWYDGKEHPYRLDPFVFRDLKEVVRRFRYARHGEEWRLSVFDDGQFIFLQVSLRAVDSLSGREGRIAHRFMAPPMMTIPWPQWVAQRIGDIELHETAEFVEFQDEAGVWRRPFFPHEGTGAVYRIRRNESIWPGELWPH